MRSIYAVASLPYPPSANRYWRNFRGRMVRSREATAYIAEVQAIMRGRLPEAGDVALELEVVRPRRSGDLDNSLKVVLDSLRGSLYVDDKQVVELHAWRMDRKGRGSVQVRAYRVLPEPAVRETFDASDYERPRR